MKTILLSHNKVSLKHHKVILTGLGRTSGCGAKKDVLKSLSNLERSNITVPAKTRKLCIKPQLHKGCQSTNYCIIPKWTMKNWFI